MSLPDKDARSALSSLLSQAEDKVDLPIWLQCPMSFSFADIQGNVEFGKQEVRGCLDFSRD